MHGSRQQRRVNITTETENVSQILKYIYMYMYVIDCLRGNSMMTHPSFCSQNLYLNFIHRVRPILTSDVLETIKSFYTNIPHNEGIEGCKLALDTIEVMQLPTEDLTHLIELIFTNNNFTFEDDNYLQSMKLLWAPGWPHPTPIFVGCLESHILEKVDKKHTVWWIFYWRCVHVLVLYCIYNIYVLVFYCIYNIYTCTSLFNVYFQKSAKKC